MFATSSLAFAVECTPEKLVGTWKRAGQVSGKEYEDCFISRDGSVHDCSRPGPLYSKGWNGVCNWSTNFSIDLEFSLSSGKLQGNKNYSDTTTGRWSGRRSDSNITGSTVKMAQDCETTERATLTALLILKNGRLEQEIMESSDPKEIGEKISFLCQINGISNQLILRYNESDNNPSVYIKN